MELCSDTRDMRGINCVNVDTLLFCCKYWFCSMHLLRVALQFTKLPSAVSQLFMFQGNVRQSAGAALQIVKYLRDATHELRYTTMVALLQPAPETYELFDDVLLLSDGADLRLFLW